MSAPLPASPATPDHGNTTPRLRGAGLVFLLMTLARGMVETFTVFLLPISTEFNWDRAQTVSVYSIGTLCIGVRGAVRRTALRSLGTARRLCDRCGPDRRGTFGRRFCATALAIAAQRRARGRPWWRGPRPGDGIAAGQQMVWRALTDGARCRRIIDGRRRAAAGPALASSCRSTPAGAARITSSAP